MFQLLEIKTKGADANRARMITCTACDNSCDIKWQTEKREQNPPAVRYGQTGRGEDYRKSRNKLKGKFR